MKVFIIFIALILPLHSQTLTPSEQMESFAVQLAKILAKAQEMNKAQAEQLAAQQSLIVAFQSQIAASQAAGITPKIIAMFQALVDQGNAFTGITSVPAAGDGH